jgi:hypothetical protein
LTAFRKRPTFFIDELELAAAAERSWRRLDGHNRLPKPILGVKVADGIEINSQAAAARYRPSPTFDNISGSVAAMPMI